MGVTFWRSNSTLLVFVIFSVLILSVGYNVQCNRSCCLYQEIIEQFCPFLLTENVQLPQHYNEVLWRSRDDLDYKSLQGFFSTISCSPTYIIVLNISGSSSWYRFEHFCFIAKTMNGENKSAVSCISTLQTSKEHGNIMFTQIWTTPPL